MSQETKDYWKQWFSAAWRRAARTFAQTAAAMIGTALVLSDVDWVMVGSGSLLAAILSLLMSISGLPEVEMPDSMKKPEVDADDLSI